MKYEVDWGTGLANRLDQAPLKMTRQAVNKKGSVAITTLPFYFMLLLEVWLIGRGTLRMGGKLPVTIQLRIDDFDHLLGI